MRVPWPDWIAELEQDAVSTTRSSSRSSSSTRRSGYDTECAVLFPETVSVAGRPVSNFGAIFCDREAARLRRVGGAAADLLRLNLPPDAACMLADPGLSQQAYILWDLIHDRAHSHGDLPFDPFMIRQRVPYWMYSLEELRCDLTAFARRWRSRPTASRSRATCSTRSCSTGSSASRSPARGCATTTASAASCCSRTCTGTATCTGPTTGSTIEWDRVGRRRRRAARRGRGALPRRDRPDEDRALDRRARSGGGDVAPAPDRGGSRACASSTTSRTRGRTSTSVRRRRVPAVDLLLGAEGEARSVNSRPRVRLRQLGHDSSRRARGDRKGERREHVRVRARRVLVGVAARVARCSATRRSAFFVFNGTGANVVSLRAAAGGARA